MLNDKKKGKVNGESSSKNPKKYMHTVENRGDYRIVGTVVTVEQDRYNTKLIETHIGFVVIDTRFYKSRLFTITQVKELLKSNEFENAVLENGEVTITENSMGRLLKFDKQAQVIGNRGLIILGKIYNDKDESVGFRIMNESGQVIDLSTKRVLSLVENNGLTLVNAKLVTANRGDAPTISAIKGTFKKITRKEVMQEEDKKQTEPVLEPTVKNALEPENAEHKEYLDKLLVRYHKSFIRRGYVKPATSHYRQKEMKILYKEFIKVHYPELGNFALTLQPHILIELGLILNILKRKKHVEGLDYFRTNKNNFILFGERGSANITKLTTDDADYLAKLAKLDPNKEIAMYYFARDTIFGMAQPQTRFPDIKTPIKDKILLKMLNTFVNRQQEVNQKVVEKKKDKPTFDPSVIDYRDVSGIEQMGYTLDVASIGVETKSEIYGNIKLRHLFEGLFLEPEQEAFLEENITSFGDVESFRLIGKMLGKAELNGGNTEAEMNKWVQAILFIQAMHNPVIAMFTKEFYKLDMIPFNITEVSQENYFLKAEDNIYYQSGLKFSKIGDFVRGQSWSYNGIGLMPEATFEAVNLVVSNSSFSTNNPHGYVWGM